MAALVAASATAQPRQGTFKPAKGEPQSWQINGHHALMWGNKPYRPVGLRVQGSVAEIDAAHRLGITDVLVDLPIEGAQWRAAIDALEERKMRYLINIDSLAPGAPGIAVEPQSYRIAGITERRTFDIPMPGVKSALVVIASRRDASVYRYEKAELENGRLRYVATPPNDLEHVMLIYPETTSIATLDSWEAFDTHRDKLLRALQAEANGPGLRGIVNPLGNMLPQPVNRTFVPQSARFKDEFAEYLEARYRNVDSCQKAWSMSISEIETWSELARLVPLWNGTRGVEHLWDPETNKLITVEIKYSNYWNDLKAMLTTAEARRYQRLIEGIRKAADVPIVQSWVGWTPQYETAVPALDGVAMRSVGTSPNQIADSAGRAASSLLRWATRGWLVAGHVEVTGPDAAVQLPNVLDDLQSMGAQAFFVSSSDANVIKAVAAENARRLEDLGAANGSPIPLFFPENALNPASIQRLPGGRWWLPAPMNGNRVELGSNFFAYRMTTDNGNAIVMWSKLAPARIKLRTANPKTLVVESIAALPLDPKVNKNNVEITLGPTPIIITGSDEIPIPEPAILELTSRFDQAIKYATELKMDVTDYAFLFRDASTGLERNPGGSFNAMVEAMAGLNSRLARYMWIEAEAFKDSTFSEVQMNPGLSDGAAVIVRSMLPGLVNDAYATYEFQNRTSQELEVWIAARIPQQFRKSVTVQIANQVLRIDGEPVSLYGAGFGWYRMGTTRFGGNMAGFRLRVAAEIGTDLAVDAIAFMPIGFRPNGVSKPDAISAP
jgi:hypothetical protein